MEPYLFYGIVLPERAQLSLQLELKFSQPVYDSSIQAKVSIVLNQVAVWVETEHEWDIYDLRNAVGNIVQDHLAMIGYLTGRAYDLELTRVLNRSRRIDHVFGIEISCLAKRGESIDFTAAMAKLRDKTSGQNGVFLRRCFGDLASSMKHPIDTGFYCYRAIESLRLHCAALHGLSAAEKPEQWEKFREVSRCDKQTLDTLKTAADPLRHGGVSNTTSNERENLFNITWNIVDKYLNSF